MRFVLAAAVLLAAIVSATCPTIANAPAGVTLEGMGQIYLPFHGYGGVENFNASFSFCELWVSPPMQYCNQQASYVAIAHPGCSHNSWYTVLTPWHWADGEAHVSYSYFSGDYVANVHVGCGHSALKLENVTGQSVSGSYNWTFYMSSMYVCSSSSRCDQWADCADCTTAPSGNCGYCANTNTCSQGTSTGPNTGSCPFSWSWLQNQCPPRPTLTPAPYTPPPSNCYQWSTCYSCTTASSGNCGWCANSNTCSLGTASGPTTGSCISWDWLSSECPATPPPTTMAPDHCAGYTTCGACTTAPSPYCGWCANTNTCSSGTANGPSTGSCVSWDWLQSECPAGEAHRPEPVGKPRGPYGSRARRH